MRLGIKNLISDDDQSSGLDLLAKLGLTSSQTRLYAIVLRNGPITVRELTRRSGIHRANVYRIVNSLKETGLVEFILGRVTRIKAVGLGEAIDILIAREEEQLDKIRSAKLRTHLELSERVLDFETPSDGSQQIFARLLIGRHMYAQQERLIQETKDEIIQVTSTKGFLLARNIGLIDSMASKAKKDGVKIRILTEIVEHPTSMLSEMPNELEIRHHPNTLTLLRYFIVDKKQLILKLAAPPKVLDQSVALWSNSPDLIQGLLYEFERLWSESSKVG